MSIYLDANATCVPDDAVIEAMRRTMGEVWGNPSSPHDEGVRSRQAVERTAALVGQLFGADPEGIVWTSGATESNNLAILGAARANPDRRHLVVSAIEHAAVLEPAAELERRGYEVSRVPADESGRVDMDAFLGALRPDTLLAALMLANNETGVLQPVDEVAAAARDVGALMLCDFAQCPGRVPVDVQMLGVDLATFSGHKFGGPVGVGALWVSPTALVRPILFGGHQQSGMRPGTINVAGIVAFGVAAARAAERLAGGNPGTLAALRDRLQQTILAAVPEAVVNGTGPRLPNTTNIAFPGASGEAIVQELATRGIAASTAAVCGGTGDPSHVLVAMGLEEARVRGAVRLSLHHRVSEPEIERAAEVIIDVARRLLPSRAVTPTTGR